ncbi:MAG: hypothetical protein ABIO91_07990 [Pyrinomonadaceae bacterium]
MLRVAFALLTISLFSSYAMAQSDCPSFSVNGPAGMVSEGEIATYSVAGGLPPETPLTIQYLWSVSAGTIVRGQGTTAIEVRQPNELLTVTVEVSGLPQGCPHTASETAPWVSAPDAVKVGVIRSLEKGRYEKEVATFVKELEENPNNQGYIFFDHKEKATKTAMARKEKIMIDALARLWGGFDRSRITIVRWNQGSDIVELWLIPPGAENPTCEECKDLNLPISTP